MNFGESVHFWLAAKVANFLWGLGVFVAAAWVIIVIGLIVTIIDYVKARRRKEDA